MLRVAWEGHTAEVLHEGGLHRGGRWWGGGPAPGQDFEGWTEGRAWYEKDDQGEQGRRVQNRIYSHLAVK